MYSLLISHDPPLPISSPLEERKQKSISHSSIFGFPGPLLRCTGSRARGLSNCGAWASLLHSMWDPWFPNQGSNLHPLHWKHEVLTTGPLRKSTSLFPNPASSFSNHLIK